jgi:Spy/CpxP family protein refolding chaperone
VLGRPVCRRALRFALLAAPALAVLGAAAVSTAARAEAAPPWQAAQRMQDLVFDAQSMLLLEESCSAGELVRRTRAQLRGALARLGS